MMIVRMVLYAVIIDLIIGDPHSWPHPIKLIGHLIAYLTKWLNRPDYSPRKKRVLGLVILLATVGLTGVVSGAIMFAASFNHYVFMVVGTYLSYTCLSSRQLAIEAQKIGTSLDNDQIKQARQQVGMIVGRDTDQLSKAQVTKATIETVAENTSDGTIAPLIFLVIGGPVLGLMYKAINTLDSMIGYKNDEFQDFGRASAIVDDVVNYVPARITWILLIISSKLMNCDTSEAIKVGRRDRQKHLSPNSAFSESVVAGALHLQLGGPHYYFGQLVEKPYIGDDFQVTPTVNHLKQTIMMMYIATFLGLIIFDGLRILIIWR